MLSIQKLLVLIVIIGAIWYGFKLVGRLDEARKAEARMRGAKKPARSARRPGRASRDEPMTQDMVQCPRCKAYYPMGTAHDCDGA